MLLLWLCVWLLAAGVQTMADFGMNKPHLLFHLGDRHHVSVNYGLSYWLNSPRKQFESTRLWYETTKEGLYIDVLSHDGEKHIHQRSNDSRYGQQTDIRYQFLEDGWEQQVQMQRQKATKYENHTAYWLTYMTVENSDPALIDHKRYSTPIQFSIKEQDTNQAEVEIVRADGSQESVWVRSEQPLKTFGFSMNISETFDVRHLLGEVKHLIEVERYKSTPRKNDSKIVEWENSQLALMRKNEWTGNKFTILVFYGEYTHRNTFTVGNRSAAFDLTRFEAKSEVLEKELLEGVGEEGPFLKHVVSNLLGGQAFYFGQLYTQNSLLNHELDFTHSFTPSRLIFPRGFLWDDGFHQLVALKRRPQLVLEILGGWLRKIDLFGWLAREQIRGSEMGSLMPELKFVYQDIFEMNPPTLMLPLVTLIERAKTNSLTEETKAELDKLLSGSFWKLEKWFRYFVRTQSHHQLTEREAVNKSVKYRWRCKDDCERGNFMGSGLDDYPRTHTPGALSKQHVDIVSWIYFFADSLHHLADYLGEDRASQYYADKAAEMREKAIDECLDKVDMLFKDQSVPSGNQFIRQSVHRLGYISLFPFLTGMLRQDQFPSNQRQRVIEARQRTLQLMADEKKLMGEDGLRSLSKEDDLFGTEDNYWRGAVWMPINFMVLRACRKYYWEDLQAQQLYGELRKRLIKSVKRNWQETGYLFENYHEGKGNRGFPFYGWTTLIANIITEDY